MITEFQHHQISDLDCPTQISIVWIPPTISLITDQVAPSVIETLLSTEAVYPILYGSNSTDLKLFCLRSHPLAHLFVFFFFFSKRSQLEREARKIDFFILKSLTFTSLRKYKPLVGAHSTSKPSPPTNISTAGPSLICPAAILSSFLPWVSESLYSGDILSISGTSQHDSLSSHFPLASIFQHINMLNSSFYLVSLSLLALILCLPFS